MQLPFDRVNNVLVVKMKRVRKNLRKIPEHISTEVQHIEGDVIVAFAQQLSKESIQRREWDHLGLNPETIQPPAQVEIIPSPERGRYSRRNVEGQIIVRRDLPKYSKTFCMQAPDFHGYGTHLVCISRDVYRRDIKPPRELTISSSVIEEVSDTVDVRFAVEEVLRKSEPDFAVRLLANLNLLLENTGGFAVYPSEASLDQYRRTTYVDWEILPVGEDDALVRRILKGRPNVSREAVGRIEERVRFLESLQPASTVVGESGLRRYFGGFFRNDVVMFENADYGNAVYIMQGAWQALSRLPRFEIMGQPGVFRIVHRPGWQLRVKEVLEALLGPDAQGAKAA